MWNCYVESMVQLALHFIFAAIAVYCTGRCLLIRLEVREHRAFFDAMLASSRAWPLNAPCYFSWIISNTTGDTYLSKVAYQTAEDAGYAGFIVWRDWFQNEALHRKMEGLEIFVQKFTLISEEQDNGFAKVDFDDKCMGAAGGDGGARVPGAATHGEIMSNRGGSVVDGSADVAGAVTPPRSG